MNKYKEWEDRLKPSLFPVVDFIVSKCPSGTVYYDIGANTGLLTSMVLEKRPDLSCVLFEPVKDYYDHIVERFSQQKNVKCINAALTNKEGEVEMSIDSSNLGWNSLTQVARYGEIQKVPGRKLDNLFKEEGLPKPYLVKIDVEESESLLVEGATSFFLENKPNAIIMEVGIKEDHFLWDKEVWMFEFLFSMGYNRFDYRKKQSTYEAIFYK